MGPEERPAGETGMKHSTTTGGVSGDGDGWGGLISGAMMS